MRERRQLLLRSAVSPCFPLDQMGYPLHLRLQYSLATFWATHMSEASDELLTAKRALEVFDNIDRTKGRSGIPNPALYFFAVITFVQHALTRETDETRCGAKRIPYVCPGIKFNDLHEPM